MCAIRPRAAGEKMRRQGLCLILYLSKRDSQRLPQLGCSCGSLARTDASVKNLPLSRGAVLMGKAEGHL